MTALPSLHTPNSTLCVLRALCARKNFRPSVRRYPGQTTLRAFRVEKTPLITPLRVKYCLVGVPTGRRCVDTAGTSVIIGRRCGKQCGFHQIFRTPGAFKETMVLFAISSECFPIHLRMFSNSLRCVFNEPPVVIKALRGSSQSLQVFARGTRVNCRKGKRVSEKQKSVVKNATRVLQKSQGDRHGTPSADPSRKNKPAKPSHPAQKSSNSVIARLEAQMSAKRTIHRLRLNFAGDTTYVHSSRRGQPASVHFTNSSLRQNKDLPT